MIPTPGHESLPTPGLYPPGSVTWRVNQERALLLGGPRALLMQLAHPLVAAGVGAHSDFRARPLPRFLRTMELTLALVFGSAEDAAAAANAINRSHRPVRGVLPETVGATPAGTPYSAADPALLLWVQATLIDSALVTYQEFVGPLTEVERETYLAEAEPVGRMLGIPAGLLPTRMAEFDSYVARTCAGLEVSPEGHGLAASVLRPPLPLVPGLAYWPMELITAGLLPDPLRRAYGIAWGGRRQRAYSAARAGIRAFLAAAPEAVRQVPPARSGRRRWSGR